jgi:mono/diheme cytochrome c family protein
MNMKRLAITGALIALGALAGWAQQDGKSIYEEKCAACHGPDGAAKNARAKKLKMKGVKETIAKVSAEDMAKVVENGKGIDMPPYGKQLSKQQIQAVVEHYRSLAK